MTDARVVAVAHFPPPVHGMAVAVERLVSELETWGRVRRVNIAAPSLDRSPTYHLVRIGRVARALAVLGRERRRCSRAFFTCDAGAGMVYTLLLTTWARICGYHVFLQHHSYAYLLRRSPVMALLVRLAGESCVHLVICAQMQEEFLATYPGAATRTVGVAADLEPGLRPPRPAASRLVLGFLGNVSLDKGLDLAVGLARAAGRRGRPVELRVAGPVVDPAAAALLDRAETDGGVDLVRVGPVYGHERDAFLDDLDVFLFPSRYSNESFGLVAWEAMARGVPVLAHRSGCTTAEALGGGGVAVERTEDFVAPAVRVLDHWWQHPDALRAAGDEARRRARTLSEDSEHEITRICEEIVGASSTGRLPVAGGR